MARTPEEREALKTLAAIVHGPRFAGNDVRPVVAADVRNEDQLRAIAVHACGLVMNKATCWEICYRIPRYVEEERIIRRGGVIPDNYPCLINSLGNK